MMVYEEHRNFAIYGVIVRHVSLLVGIYTDISEIYRSGAIVITI